MKSQNIFDEQEESFLENLFLKLAQRYRNKIEKYIIYKKERWAFFFFIEFLYIWRVYAIGGFYVISYIMGLYILHLGVQFFTPVGLPYIEDEDEDNDIMQLPTYVNERSEERGPLLRSMSEFKFWQGSTLAASISICLTTTDLFNLPVFWPFLLAYFLLLFVLTIKRQFKHMAKYKYNLQDFTMKSKK